MAVARRTSQNDRKQYFQTTQTRKTRRDVVRPSRCNAFAIARFLVVDVLSQVSHFHSILHMSSEPLRVKIRQGVQSACKRVRRKDTRIKSPQDVIRHPFD